MHCSIYQKETNICANTIMHFTRWRSTLIHENISLLSESARCILVFLSKSSLYWHKGLCLVIYFSCIVVVEKYKYTNIWSENMYNSCYINSIMYLLYSLKSPQRLSWLSLSSSWPILRLWLLRWCMISVLWEAL